MGNRKRKRGKDDLNHQVKSKAVSGTTVTAAAASSSSPSSSLFSKMEKQLSGGQFRWLNEAMYTSSSEESAKLFLEEPELFDVYHTGFASQCRSWPIHPLDQIIAMLKHKLTAFPTAVIADLCCGDGRLAKEVVAGQESGASGAAGHVGEGNKKKRRKKKKGNQAELAISSSSSTGPPALSPSSPPTDPGTGVAVARRPGPTVYSYDFAARASHVQPCNVAKGTPLADKSADFAVLCLALMGLDWAALVAEARRLVRPGHGRLFLAEVRSRIPSIDRFEQRLRELGFEPVPNTAHQHQQQQLPGNKTKGPSNNNQFFVVYELSPIEDYRRPSGKKTVVQPYDMNILKPCIYKKR